MQFGRNQSIELIYSQKGPEMNFITIFNYC